MYVGALRITAPTSASLLHVHLLQNSPVREYMHYFSFVWFRCVRAGTENKKNYLRSTQSVYRSLVDKDKQITTGDRDLRAM